MRPRPSPRRPVQRSSLPFCRRSQHLLRLRDRGDDVRNLQLQLKEQGVFVGDATGFFGPATQNAVIKFQLKMQIVSTANANGAGLVGPKTLEKILKHCGPAVANSFTTATSSTTTVHDLLQLREDIRGKDKGHGHDD
jgi:peptidoglycan hydrolase-like protein with peptidoglycan-binding domain